MQEAFAEAYIYAANIKKTMMLLILDTLTVYV
jgi:hypothetical protein